MIGTLSLIDLEVQAVVGILPHERERLQPLYFCVDMEVDFSKTLSSHDKLDLDYAEVAEALKLRVIEKKYGLLEDLLVDCGQASVEILSSHFKAKLIGL